jgi:hypothetical protein
MMVTRNPLCVQELILFAVLVVLLFTSINPGVRGREQSA